MGLACLLLGLGACRPTYEEAREACGLAPGEFVPPFRAYRMLTREPGSPATSHFHRISETCAETMGRALHVNWESFGERPHAVEADEDPEKPAAIVVSGMAMLVAQDFGSVGDLRRLEGVPPSLYRFLGPKAQDGAADLPLGPIVYDAIVDAIWSVKAADFEGRRPAGAMYTPGGVVLVSRKIRWNEVTAAANIVHEALHSQSPHDLSCDKLVLAMTHPERVARARSFDDCDQSLGGVYGGVAALFYLVQQSMGEHIWDPRTKSEISKDTYYDYVNQVAYLGSQGEHACGQVCEIGGATFCRSELSMRWHLTGAECRMVGGVPTYVPIPDPSPSP